MCIVSISESWWLKNIFCEFVHVDPVRVSVQGLRLRPPSTNSLPIRTPLPKLVPQVKDPVTYTLPDGSQVDLYDELWKVPEALFNPNQVGLEAEGVAGLLWDCVAACDIDIRKSLLANIVLSGGSTMFKGFDERLSQELLLMSRWGFVVQCLGTSERFHVAIFTMD